jgi:16S rRNA (cytosine967-C5)-methyltransferase
VKADPARVEALATLLNTGIGRIEVSDRGAGPAAARARDLVAGVRRHLLTIDAILDLHVEKGIARVEPRLLGALRLGVYQLLYESSVAKPLVVASTVALGGPSAKRRGFLNAVLRRIAGAIREESGTPPRRRRDVVMVGPRSFARFPLDVLPDPETDLVSHLSVHFSQLPWFVEALMRDVGDEIDDLLIALMLPLPLAVRVNGLRATTAEAEAALTAAGASILRRFGDVLEVRLPGAITDCPPFAEGLVTVQDVVASEVAPFAGPLPGERILDLCAGVGGKAIHMAEIARGAAEVVAADLSAARLAKLADNLARLRTPGVSVVHLDQVDLAKLGPFDRVLVDAPCSNSGVLMKRVAARYRLNPEAVLALARTQLDLLRRGAAVLRPGGTLVYSTCSILPQENGAVVSRFLEERGGSFVVEEQRLRHPHRTGRDGGYMARLRSVAQGTVTPSPP